VQVAGRRLANVWLIVAFIGILTVRACLHEADEGLLAGFLYAACSAANWTSLKQLQQAILCGVVDWECLCRGGINRQPSGKLHFVLKKGQSFLLMHFTTKIALLLVSAWLGI
jgi:hypothetical protein